MNKTDAENFFRDLMKQGVTLNSRASKEAIESKENTLGCQLSDHLKQLYLLHNGSQKSMNIMWEFYTISKLEKINTGEIFFGSLNSSGGKIIRRVIPFFSGYQDAFIYAIECENRAKQRIVSFLDQEIVADSLIIFIKEFSKRGESGVIPF